MPTKTQNLIKEKSTVTRSHKELQQIVKDSNGVSGPRSWGNSLSLLSGLEGRDWILVMLLIAQPILLTVGYQSISRIQTISDTTELQLAAITEVREVTEHLLLLGEYRGSCATAALVHTGEQSWLDTLCAERYNELTPVYPSLPVRQNSNYAEFFQRVTEINQQNIDTLNRLYVESKAILDPQALTYQLGFEVYRFYPQLMEHLGFVRGSLAGVKFGGADAKVLFEKGGAIAQVGQTFVDTMLLNSSNLSEYEALVTAAIEYAQGVTDFALMPTAVHTSAERTQIAIELFDQGTKMIRALAAASDRDALELGELLSARLDAALGEMRMTIALLALLQLLLLMSAKRSLEGVRAMNLSARAEQTAREKLETMLEQQKEMFAIIGHELRTPVATVKMLTSDSDTQDRDKLEQINEISDNLLHVLEDLRVVIAPERALAAKRSERDNPIRVVSRALSSLEGLLRDHGCNLELQLPENRTELFSFHTQALRQSTTNLVKNAALHSSGTRILVTLTLTPRSVDRATLNLRVEDDGQSIPDHLRDSVFEAFKRGDTQADGSGLGLFIVNNMADLMGGTLTYSQSSMGGAAFELSLPIFRAEAEQPDTNHQPTERLSLDGLRVLFAEDDAMLRMLTTKLLTKAGAQVDGYENGRLALEAFSPEKYDLVITDLMMPELNGHELTRAIRTQSKEVIIIAVTAAVLGAETEQFNREGANLVLPKPITTANLIEALNELKSTPDLSREG